MKDFKWLKVEKSKIHDYPRDARYIIKTYKFLGIPIHKEVIRWF
ncbi:hypothetical protein [Ammoniphilus sp. YIM 78166]|nr:hypothetical protein [Ammoniphilus sp. YIM 78166]